MRYFYLLFFFIFFYIDNTAQTVPFNVVYPEDYGAKADGKTNSTDAFQKCVDILNSRSGGQMVLSQGEYLVDSLRLGLKTSLVGCGIGVTILKQSPSSNAPCVIVPSQSGGFEISSLTIVGYDKNIGLYFEKSVAEREHHEFSYTSLKSWNHIQPYKWAGIHDICIYKFDIGLCIEPSAYNVNIQNCTFGKNGDGVILKCSDSAISNCYVNNNNRNGLWVVGSNNRISDVKSIFNGREDARKYAAVLIEGNRCLLTNVETQDNYCKGFHIKGTINLLANCLSNTDGYSKEPKGYDANVDACGFLISSINNSFSNCAVTNYTNKYGPVFKRPIMVDPKVEYYYVDIYKDIKVLLATGWQMFNEPISTSLGTASKNNIVNATISDRNNGGKYFCFIKGKDCFVPFRDSYDYAHLNTLTDFRLSNVSTSMTIWSIGDKGDGLLLRLYSSGQNLMLSLYSNKGINCQIPIEEPAQLISQDCRIISSFEHRNDKVYVVLRAYLNYSGKGWVKKEIANLLNEDLIEKINANQSVILLGKSSESVQLKRLIMSYEPMADNYTVPGTPTIELRAGSFIYLDADSFNNNPFTTSGSSSGRPMLTKYDIGYQYFDTSVNAPLWWNGTEWVDANGKTR